MQEIWKDIKDFEGLYQVSNLGRVRSLGIIFIGHNQYGNTFISSKKSTILKPYYRKEYLTVHLRKNKKSKYFLVHRLVAQAFIPNPNNYPCVNHKDENKQNNCVENLEWFTYSYNSNYGTRNQKISKNGRKPINQYTLQGEFLKKWSGIVEINQQLGFLPSGISSCCSGRYKSSNGFLWRYAD